MVHELLFDGETAEESEDLHPSELKGRNITQVNGIWPSILEENGLSVSAGPVLHTVPCLGYAIQELPRPLSIDPTLYLPQLLRNSEALLLQGIKNPRKLLTSLKDSPIPITLPDGTILTPPGMGGMGRKVVILGDTYDASGCTSIAMNADLLVHESTNAYLPTLDAAQAGESITQLSVLETAAAHGHSTPEVAGRFARSIMAKGLVLNHISVKYSAPIEKGQPGFMEAASLQLAPNGQLVDLKREMIEEIGRLASVAWGGGKAIVARDFLEIEVPRKRV